MAQWQRIPIGTSNYRPRAGSSSIERLVNMYPEPNKNTAKNPVTLYAVPGLKLWSTIGSGPCRGLHADGNGSLWVVSGTELYYVTPAKSATLVGNIPGTQIVRMVDNRTHVLIAAENKLFYATSSTLLEHTTVMDVRGVAYMDGRGIMIEAGTQKVWCTDADDFTTINGLAFETADANTDNVVALAKRGQQFAVGKERSIDWFYNAGRPTFPFIRVPNGITQVGVAGAGAMAVAGNFLYWVGDDGKFYRAGGYAEEEISTPDIEKLIQGAESLSSVEVYTIKQVGHWHVHVQFSDLCLVYDTKYGSWFERQSYGLGGRWRAQCYAQLGSTHLVGDYSDGTIYELDADTYDENGDPLVKENWWPPLSADPGPVFVPRLYLEVEAGVGLESGQGSDPTVMLSWSDDDGRTWSSDINSSIGQAGEWRHRALFNRLGRSHNRTFRTRISDPVRTAILGAAAMIEVGAA